MGGAWERIIRSIRKILRALLGQQLVTDEMLQTLMAAVAGILNSRPLTPVSSDLKDLEHLTPNICCYWDRIQVCPLGPLARKIVTASATGDRCSTSQTYSGSAG